MFNRVAFLFIPVKTLPAPFYTFRQPLPTSAPDKFLQGYSVCNFCAAKEIT